jgi:hypothetical protein
MLAAVETVTFALIGAAAELHRCVPRLIDERRTKFDQQVTLARFLGQMAVNQAQSEIRRRLVTVPASPASAPAPPPVQAQEPGATSTSEQSVAVAEATTVASDLAIDLYDELSASQVIGLLTHLDADELDAVYRYESEHRRRRTVLGRVEHLRSQGR